MIEAIKKLSRNTLFRLSLLGAFLFVGTLFIAMGYVYFATISSEIRRVDTALLTEIKELEQLYEKEGPNALNKEVILRSATGEGLYVFRHQNIFAGNLAELPAREVESRWKFLSIGRDSNYSKRPIIYSQRGTEGTDLIDRRARTLAGPLKVEDNILGSILVGRDVESTMRNAERIRTSILTSAGLSLFFGLLSSWFVSRRFTRRVEAFNKLADDVRSGNLDRRAPRNYSEDEMDMLAEHLNAMLDHIDRLMKAMRYAGDSVAHDLRTPLTRLRTRLESAAIDLGDTPEADTLFAAAGDASELLKTFDGVLRIARLEAGERRELLTDVDPKPMLDDLAELYEPACEDAGLSFTSDISSGIMVLADRGLLSQAVSNLIENAIKYTPKGGTIELKLEKNKAGRAVISITDNGPGIPAEDRERVKERFVRLDKSRTLPGSGLGLALVDAVADLHRAEFIMGAGLGTRAEAPGLKAALVLPRRKSLKGK